MILVNNLSQLQQYNLAYKQDLYFQPIVLPADISLQGFLPKQIQNNYSIEVQLTSYDGDEYIADITGSFKVLFAVSSNNQNYFNIQLKEFPSIFDDVELFTLKIIVRNAGFLLFSKITEPYRKLKTSKMCYAVIDDFAMMIISKAGYIKINNETFQFGQGLQDSGFEIDYNEGNYYLYVDCLDTVQVGYCYKGDDVKIDISLIATEFLQENGCQLPLIKLSATYNCFDNVKGAYYGDPKTLLNYSGNDQTLIHQNSFYISGQLQLQPAEIKRNITFLGKPQRVENIEKVSVFGLEIFPDWKMREIESILSGRRIFVDGIEYIHRGAKAFTRDEVQGSNSWIFKTEFENAPKINDFTCIEDCITNCYYFVITSGTKDQDYYREDKSKIGDTYQELFDYFNSLNDVISVTDINVATVGCHVTAVLKIDSFGYVPSFIYYKMPLNEYRIFVKFDDCQNPIKLCEGMTNCGILPSGIFSEFTSYVGCREMPSEITSQMESSRTYQPFRYSEVSRNWKVNDYDFKRYNDKKVELYFQAIGSGINDTIDLIDERIMKLDVLGIPTTDVSESFENVSIYIDTEGWVFVTGNTTNNLLTVNITYNI